MTYKNSGLQEVVKEVSLDHIVLETDAPYLAPVPYRGRQNEPALVSVVGEFLAQLREEDVEVVRQETSKNTARLFKISPP